MTLLTVAEEFAITVGAKVTMPSKSLLQGAIYTRAVETNLKARFDRLMTPDFNDDAACKVQAIENRRRMRA